MITQSLFDRLREKLRDQDGTAQLKWVGHSEPAVPCVHIFRDSDLGMMLILTPNRLWVWEEYEGDDPELWGWWEITPAQRILLLLGGEFNHYHCVGHWQNGQRIQCGPPATDPMRPGN